MTFSKRLQGKIDPLLAKQRPTRLGAIQFKSPYLLAPMASISNAPYRKLMQDLGSGGAISELVSCHGINHGNDKTLKMLTIDAAEEVTGIQIFGEDAHAMAACIDTVARFSPKFIDINMGCPVRKVVGKGGGSALLQDPAKLTPFFKTIKNACGTLPLSIKIRTGWDQHQLNSKEVAKIALDCGIEWVAIHGRTRTQQYKGLADWNYIEKVAAEKLLPIIGNGDLNQASIIRERQQQTHCQALMIARGSLRNPFIFLESEITDEAIQFTGEDYFEVIEKLSHYMHAYTERENVLRIQLKKMIVWFAAGFPQAAKFRSHIFLAKTIGEVLKISQDYFLGHAQVAKTIDLNSPFMTSGHG